MISTTNPHDLFVAKETNATFANYEALDMADPLAIYLHDHLAGATLAIDVLEALQEQHRGEPLGDFAAAILGEVKSDHLVLKALSNRVGEGSDVVKEATAWMSEKVSRFKLRRGASSGLGSFEALEFLALGIQGKLALWSMLSAIAGYDNRLETLDLAQLIDRAHSQHARVETQRLAQGRIALAKK